MKSGIYKYFLNGKPTDISEKFFIETKKENVKFFHSTRKIGASNTEIRVVSTITGDKHHKCQIDYRDNQRKIRAIYEFQGKTLYFLRQESDKNQEHEILELAENTVFFPLMRCFQGTTILQVAENKSFTTVLVPDIKASTDLKNFLRPSFDQRKAKFIKKDFYALYKPESVSLEADLYQYFSEHYDENSQFWLNKDGLLAAYRFLQSKDAIWEIFLESSSG